MSTDKVTCYMFTENTDEGDIHFGHVPIYSFSVILVITSTKGDGVISLASEQAGNQITSERERERERERRVESCDLPLA